MKRMIVIILLLYSGNLFAQSDPESIVQKFFKIYDEKASDAALDYLFGTNKWMEDSKDQIENVKFKLNSQVVKSMGKYYGYELLTYKAQQKNCACTRTS